MFPQLISDKIFCYIWRHKIKTCNREFHRSLIIADYYPFFYSISIKNKDYNFRNFNYRNNKEIYNKYHKKIGLLPIKYFHTSD